MPHRPAGQKGRTLHLDQWRWPSESREPVEEAPRPDPCSVHDIAAAFLLGLNGFAVGGGVVEGCGLVVARLRMWIATPLSQETCTLYFTGLPTLRKRDASTSKSPSSSSRILSM